MAYLMSQGIQIGKVAERTGLSIDTIRFYQKIGLVKQAARSEGGFRLFTDADMKDLAFIKRAQELGFSLNEVKQLSFLNQSMATPVLKCETCLQASSGMCAKKRRNSYDSKQS
jgi:DNA-binding transcriptional MerR regulator